MTTTKTRKKAGQAPANKGQEPNLNLSEATVDELVQESGLSTNGNGAKPVPGEKGYDWQADYPGERVFLYTTPKGQTTAGKEPYEGIVIGLAAISEDRQPDVGFLDDIRMKPEFDQVLDMTKIVTCPAAWALIRRFRPTDLQNMFEEWSEWSNSTAGKS